MKVKPLILIVEDNPGILLNLKVTLDFNGFNTNTARNGKEAINNLSKMEVLPDLILSDIMMPEMDGFDFFKNISRDLTWSQIPFVFLTARADPEDIRFGKMLGVDDYITKPFKEEDLIATIRGKIFRNKKIRRFKETLIERLKIDDYIPSLETNEIESIGIFISFWDEVIGPDLRVKYPKNFELSLSLNEIGTQLFMAANSIYGYTANSSARGILLEIENISRFGYIYFDAIPDEEVRGGIRRYMIVTLASNITYFDSLKIKLIFEELSLRIKEKQNYDIKNIYDKITQILLKEE
ncbi:MAG: response regulator [Candidatus Lokiarchaeota archaeon]|nr:response regulator [Candidatus Lokiarchaeota archaeon]